MAARFGADEDEEEGEGGAAAAAEAETTMDARLFWLVVDEGRRERRLEPDVFFFAVDDRGEVIA